jgi:hypothetical protein
MKKGLAILFISLSSFTIIKEDKPRKAKAVAMVQVAPESDPFVKVYFAWIDSLTDPNENLDTSITYHQDSLPKLRDIIEIK